MNLRVPLFKFYLSFLLLVFDSNVNAQSIFRSGNTFINVGLSLSLGTHVNQMGTFVRSFTSISDNFQWNNEFRLSVNIRYLGPKKTHLEMQFSSGVTFGYGKKRTVSYLFMNKNSNFTGLENSVSYIYNLYFNKIGSSQQTGSVSFSANDFYFLHENDILARPTLDRFRTAGIQIAFQYQNIRFSITQFNWTGMLGRQKSDSLYPSPSGYLDTTAHRYGLFSHGILCTSAEFLESSYHQQIKIGVGIDAEQIRNFVQNRVVHDGFFLPNSWRNKNNYHFPMMDSNGQQFLYRKNQKIKRPRFFLNSYLNSDLIY